MMCGHAMPLLNSTILEFDQQHNNKIDITSKTIRAEGLRKTHMLENEGN
jgi:hypothetical protein